MGDYILINQSLESEALNNSLENSRKDSHLSADSLIPMYTIRRAEVPCL